MEIFLQNEKMNMRDFGLKNRTVQDYCSNESYTTHLL